MNHAVSRARSALAIVALAMLLGLAPAAAAENDNAFPAPLPGWTADAVEVHSTQEELMGMAMTRRRFLREYRTNDGAAGLAVTIDSFDCMAAATIDALHTDADMQRQAAPQMKPMRFGDYPGVETFNDAGVRDMIGLKVSDCGILSIGGPAPPDGAIDAYLRRIDFGRMGGLLR